VLEAGTYAGDARIDNLPPGQERLLSYGVDLQMLVNATKNRQENSILSGKIVKGVLHIQRKHLFTQEYLAENKHDNRARTLIVEHPLRRGWTLVQPEKPLETTDALYRFRVEVPAGKTESLTVQEQLVQGEAIEILPVDFGTLLVYSRTGEIPAEVRDALAKAAAMKQAMEEYQRQVRERQQEINRITQEQQRIRENIKTVNERTALHKRLVDKLTEQENQIDDLYKRMDEAQKAFEKQRKELENYVANLNIG
jgi:vacuolar-type H+-ATPase subunit I/STV1